MDGGRADAGWADAGPADSGRADVDWAGLRAAAAEAAGRAYAPYSRLRVGAAGLTDDGRVVTGCNVENASYGLTLCAECGLVSALHAGSASLGARRPGPAEPAGPPDTAGSGPALVAVAIVAGDGEPLMPCGRCRQLLLEAGGPGLLVDVGSSSGAGPASLEELLPGAFGAADVATRGED